MNWNWTFRTVWMLCLGVNDMSREMKDSGVEWIGEMPEDWNVQRVKNAFVRKKTEAHQENPVVLSLARAGVKVRDLSKNEGQIAESYYNYNLVDPGDLLLNPMDLYSGANCSVSNVKGVISQAYINLRAQKGYNSKFYDYYFKTLYWAMVMFVHGKGVSFENRWTLGIEELFNYKIPVPLECEQRKIANFLDDKCENIDTVIEKTKMSIEKYKKLKETIVVQTVTKGVEKKRKMKNTKIEWLEKIPFEWKECRIKNVIFPVRKEVNDTDEIVTCFRDGAVTLRKNRREDGFTISFTEKGYHGVDKGDLVIHGMDAFAGAIGCSDSRGKITPVVHVCETTGNNRYFMYFLRSMAYGNILMDLSNGVRIRSSDYRNFAKLGIFRMCVPPLEEQNLIVEFLDRKVNEIEKIVEKKQIFCQELEAYKKSLIYEYVTGKKEVPES